MTVSEAAPPRSSTDTYDTSTVVHWILRISVWGCFVGHGAFGVRQKLDWLVFFHPFGFDDRTAFLLMPVIGAVDISVGFFVLLYPTRAALLYAAVWGGFTACLRPIVGLSGFEMIERAGNFGPPLALLLCASGVALLSPLPIAALDNPSVRRRQARITVVITSLLLLGHGGLACLGKPMLVKHWESVGVVALDEAGTFFTQCVGGVEIALAVAVLSWPTRALCLVILSWKLFTESLFVAAGEPAWEVLERAGSFGAPLALFFLLVPHERMRLLGFHARP